ncbi:MAG: hypothetical protein U0Y10_24755 [Spirosomataceae bacterium]
MYYSNKRNTVKVSSRTSNQSGGMPHRSANKTPEAQGTSGE